MQDPSQLTAAVRRVLLNEAKNHRFDQVPVFCGSSLKNKGVQQLLDAVDALLPSPLDVALPDIFYYVNKELLSIPFEDALHGKASPSLSRYLKKKPLIMYAFKLQYTTQGMIVFARVYQGELKTKGTVYNTRTKKTEKVLRLVHIFDCHT
jgi:elongation factor G 1